MKHSLKTLTIAACLSLALFTSCSLIPGNDQYKIRTATKEYAKTHLNEGEKYQWGHMERKCGRNFDGKDCKYAEVYYDVVTESGETLHKTLYLLMSEHCDSLYDVSEAKDKEWISRNTLSGDEVKALIKDALKDIKK